MIDKLSVLVTQSFARDSLLKTIIIIIIVIINGMQADMSVVHDEPECCELATMISLMMLLA